jgi:hypothetical protein
MSSFRTLTAAALLTAALGFGGAGQAATTGQIDSPQLASSKAKLVQVAQNWNSRAKAATRTVPQRRGNVASSEHGSIKGTINGGGDFVKGKSRTCSYGRTC